MKVKAFNNNSFSGCSQYTPKTSARDMEIVEVDWHSMRSHADLCQAAVCVVKYTRRGIWLYNGSVRTPHWNQSKGVRWGIVLSYEDTEEERRQKEAQAYWSQALKSPRQVGKAAALAVGYGMGPGKLLIMSGKQPEDPNAPIDPATILAEGVIEIENVPIVEHKVYSDPAWFEEAATFNEPKPVYGHETWKKTKKGRP